jgi:hypothetical protein
MRQMWEATKVKGCKFGALPNVALLVQFTAQIEK